MITTETLATFLASAQAKSDTSYARAYARDGFAGAVGPKLSLETGRRYVRIVADNGSSQRMAFGFVDMTNGDVLKADGWKTPAKNFARGNVTDANTGTGRMSWTGVA